MSDDIDSPMNACSEPGRKIDLGPEFCPVPYPRGGNEDCDHDYPPEPAGESDNGAHWICSRCGCRVTFDYWD